MFHKLTAGCREEGGVEIRVLRFDKKIPVVTRRRW